MDAPDPPFPLFPSWPWSTYQHSTVQPPHPTPSTHKTCENHIGPLLRIQTVVIYQRCVIARQLRLLYSSKLVSFKQLKAHFSKGMKKQHTFNKREDWRSSRRSEREKIHKTPVSVCLTSFEMPPLLWEPSLCHWRREAAPVHHG